MKEDIVSNFSNGRATSSSNLYYAEADAIIRHLGMDKGREDPAYKMRGKILSLAHQLDWHVAGTQKIDFPRLNAWCVKFGYLHKRLDQYKYRELPTLVTQFEKMYNDFIKKL